MPTCILSLPSLHPKHYLLRPITNGPHHPKCPVLPQMLICLAPTPRLTSLRPNSTPSHHHATENSCLRFASFRLIAYKKHMSVRAPVNPKPEPQLGNLKHPKYPKTQRNFKANWLIQKFSIFSSRQFQYKKTTLS